MDGAKIAEPVDSRGRGCNSNQSCYLAKVQVKRAQRDQIIVVGHARAGGAGADRLR